MKKREYFRGYDLHFYLITRPGNVNLERVFTVIAQSVQVKDSD